MTAEPIWAMPMSRPHGEYGENIKQSVQGRKLAAAKKHRKRTAFETPSARRGCTSAFAKTPQRDAIG